MLWPITARHWLEGRWPADFVAVAVTCDQQSPQIHCEVSMGAGHELAPSSGWSIIIIIRIMTVA